MATLPTSALPHPLVLQCYDFLKDSYRKAKPDQGEVEQEVQAEVQAEAQAKVRSFRATFYRERCDTHAFASSLYKLAEDGEAIIGVDGLHALIRKVCDLDISTVPLDDPEFETSLQIQRYGFLRAHIRVYLAKHDRFGYRYAYSTVGDFLSQYADTLYCQRDLLGLEVDTEQVDIAIGIILARKTQSVWHRIYPTVTFLYDASDTFYERRDEKPETFIPASGFTRCMAGTLLLDDPDIVTEPIKEIFLHEGLNRAQKVEAFALSLVTFVDRCRDIGKFIRGFVEQDAQSRKETRGESEDRVPQPKVVSASIRALMRFQEELTSDVRQAMIPIGTSFRKVDAKLAVLNSDAIRNSLSPPKYHQAFREKYDIQGKEALPLEIFLKELPRLDLFFSPDEEGNIDNSWNDFHRFLSLLKSLRKKFIRNAYFHAFMEMTENSAKLALFAKIESTRSPEERRLIIDTHTMAWGKAHHEDIRKNEEELFTFLDKIEAFYYRTYTLLHFRLPKLEEHYEALRREVLPTWEKRSKRLQADADRLASSSSSAAPSTPRGSKKKKKKKSVPSPSSTSSPKKTSRTFFYSGPIVHVIQKEQAEQSAEQALFVRAEQFATLLNHNPPETDEGKNLHLIVKNHFDVMRHILGNGCQDAPRRETAVLLFHAHQALQGALKLFLLEMGESSYEDFLHKHDLINLSRYAGVFEGPKARNAKAFIKGMRRMNEYWRYPADSYLGNPWALDLVRNLHASEPFPMTTFLNVFGNTLACLEYLYSEGNSKYLKNIHPIAAPTSVAAPPEDNIQHYRAILRKHNDDPDHAKKIARRYPERIYLMHAWIEQLLRKRIERKDLAREHNLAVLFDASDVTFAEKEEEEEMRKFLQELSRANKAVELGTGMSKNLKRNTLLKLSHELRREELSSPFFLQQGMTLADLDSSTIGEDWNKVTNPESEEKRRQLLEHDAYLFQLAERMHGILHP